MEANAARHDKVQFGDFQTPWSLARTIAGRVKASGFAPASIVEPSCGVGNLLLAAADALPGFHRAIGVELQQTHVRRLRQRLAGRPDQDRIDIQAANFFGLDWRTLVSGLADPLLVIGNPPWVTNTELSSLGSHNLPSKTNFQGRSGLDALTGKSNFDISEAILLRIVEWLTGRDAMLAMLCKTSVARKILVHAWKHRLSITAPSIRRIDSMSSFDASVDACLFECRFGDTTDDFACPVYSSLSAESPVQTIGFHGGRVLADVAAFDRWSHLEGEGLYRWRSGIKHDCSEVVELIRVGESLRTKRGRPVNIEDDFLFPMLKASDLGNGRVLTPRRWVLVTQRSVNDDTRRIAEAAPKTWAYLLENAERFDQRASAIYRGRPPFSIFGVGDYSFSPWKVGIAGLYKKLAFEVIGPFAGKPVVLDDTCYFLSCETKQEAELIASLLNSTAAQDFYQSFVFWDSKRPVTVDLLRRLDIERVARAVGKWDEFSRVARVGVLTGMLWAE